MRFDPRTTLLVQWSKRERDVWYRYPRRTDGHWIHNWLSGARLWPGGEWMREHKDSPFGAWPFDGPSFLKELDERGYDVTTLRISVKLKKPDPTPEAQR